MKYANKVPLCVSPEQKIGELMELGAFRGFDKIEYDVRRGVFYGVVSDSEASAPLLNAETLMGDRPMSMFLRPQA